MRSWKPTVLSAGKLDCEKEVLLRRGKVGTSYSLFVDENNQPKIKALKGISQYVHVTEPLDV